MFARGFKRLVPQSRLLELKSKVWDGFLGWPPQGHSF